ncbi:MAG TPA: PEP/pyruvate-binding domain-containing protein [Candidatus Cloacimonadota bacterium]|nr:PEP/pyruvate-binding domain-containing protein [Candidatus Cloacimonadota bacterium]
MAKTEPKPFNRKENEVFTYLGTGEYGEKAHGLIHTLNYLEQTFPKLEFEGIEIFIPKSLVIMSDVFTQFMDENCLWDLALSDLPDEHIAQIFQKASLPTLLSGDLYEFALATNYPLAVRSSSILEDSLNEPFAGIYHTKMLPNWYLDPQARFQKIIQAVKLIWSSVYTQSAKRYFKAIKRDIRTERMAVLIQEVVGSRYGDRYYPAISGVARSYNYYAYNDHKPEDGVINLALGLGKTIVDGGNVWQYSPTRPASPPPFSVTDMLHNTQSSFYAIHMGEREDYDPINPDEFLDIHYLPDAKWDGTLAYCGRVYNEITENPDYEPWIVDFSPILIYDMMPLNNLLHKLLKMSEKIYGLKVEIEFAIKADPQSKPKFGFLQIRPMIMQGGCVEVKKETGKNVLLYGENVLGNGFVDDITDVIMVKRESFDPKNSYKIAAEMDKFNKDFLDSDKRYLLITYGRLGSSDPWLGIPVDWSSIGKVSVIVESTLPGFNPELSQGSHFFHNLLAFQVKYFSISESDPNHLDYEWLNAQTVIRDGKFLKHLQLKKPLKIQVDGRKRTGIIYKNEE